MTEGVKIQIRRLREEGYGYKDIAKVLVMPAATVKSFCQRDGINGRAENSITDQTHFCLCCGLPVRQNEGRKEKKFCSDTCRTVWWNNHLDQVTRKAYYESTCACCKKTFQAYGNSSRKYCSRECYITARFRGNGVRE